MTARPRYRYRSLLVILALVASSMVGGCADQSSAESTSKVVVSFYPLEYVAERIAADTLTIGSLTPPGADPHHLELTPKQVAGLDDETALVVYTSGLTPALDDALEIAEPGRVLDTADAADLDASDPHFWLDPTRLASVAQQVADTFAKLQPEHAADYRKRARALVADLDRLDKTYARHLAPCAGDTVVTSHEAFGYLAERYGLRQAGVKGIDPDEEPSPARLREVTEIVHRNGVRTLFFETSTGPDTTRALAEDLSVRTDVLDPIETQSDENDDYLDVMESNLAALRRGLPCAGTR